MKFNLNNKLFLTGIALCLTACDQPPRGMTAVGGTAASSSSNLPAAPAPVPTVAAPTPAAAPAPAPTAAPAPAPVAAPAPITGPKSTIQPSMPPPLFAGTPLPADNSIPNMDKSKTAVLTAEVPEGVMLISAKAPVTSSCPNPFVGELKLVTDGEKDGSDGYFVELDPGKQWLQVDLGSDKEVWAVWLWHYHKQGVVYKGVVVQVSSDPEFKTSTTIFNNDYDNSVGQGKGADLSYVETNNGRLMKANGVKGRYVRFWSNGRYLDEMNHYIEVEVYGK